MTEEKKEKKESPKVETVLERIMVGEVELMETNEPIGYSISLSDVVRSKIGAIKDTGTREKYANEHTMIMQDEGNDDNWKNMISKFITASNQKYPISEIHKAVEQRIQQGITGALSQLDAKVTAVLVEEG
ncbi:MAG: hypothetical protein ACW99U_21705, partial [Candidatus Thorarchaeota archaeon]